MALEWQTLLVVSAVASLLWMLSRALKQQIMPPPGSKIPPMPPTSSVIGHLELLDPLLHKKALLLAKDYGPVFRLKLFSREVVIINDLENLKAFSAVNELLDRPDELNRGREFYNGLMTLNGELWSANRRFCMTMLRDLGFARCKTEEKMMTEFNILKEKIEELDGEPMSMGRYIPECLTCNIAAFFYGSCLPENSSVRLQFNDLLRRFLEIFAVADVLMFAPKFVQWLLGHFPFTTIGKGYVLMDELDRFIMKEIVSQSPTSTGDMKRNFVPRYLEKVEESKEDMNPKFEYRHLVGNVKALIGAGILGATASVLFHLANFAAHQDTLQRRVQEEIDEVLGPDREPTWEDRKRMHFTFACVIEAERCKASVPLGIPRLASKDVVVNNFFIKKGTVVLFNLWGIDNDPLYWKEPQRFNPFRYLSEEGYFLPETARRVVAFSLGRRSCPGETFALMEIFLIITFLLQKYQVVHHEPFHLNLEGGEVDASDLGRVKIRFIPRRAGSHGANISST